MVLERDVQQTRWSNFPVYRLRLAIWQMPDGPQGHQQCGKLWGKNILLIRRGLLYVGTTAHLIRGSTVPNRLQLAHAGHISSIAVHRDRLWDGLEM